MVLRDDLPFEVTLVPLSAKGKEYMFSWWEMSSATNTGQILLFHYMQMSLFLYVPCLLQCTLNMPSLSHFILLSSCVYKAATFINFHLMRGGSQPYLS